MISREMSFGLDIVTAQIAGDNLVVPSPHLFLLHEKISHFRKEIQNFSNLHQVFYEPFVANAEHLGVVSGPLYLAFKRNLLPIMLAHGLTNTIGLTMLYLGVTP